MPQFWVPRYNKGNRATIVSRRPPAPTPHKIIHLIPTPHTLPPTTHLRLHTDEREHVPARSVGGHGFDSVAPVHDGLFASLDRSPCYPCGRCRRPPLEPDPPLHGHDQHRDRRCCRYGGVPCLFQCTFSFPGGLGVVDWEGSERRERISC